MPGGGGAYEAVGNEFCGAVMVCGILLVRAAGYHRVSKQTFLVLWMAAALRFLTPWQLPWSPEFWGYLPENQKLWGERVEEMAAVPFAGAAAAGEEQEVSVSSMTGENQQPETVPAGREPGRKGRGGVMKPSCIRRPELFGVRDGIRC